MVTGNLRVEGWGTKKEVSPKRGDRWKGSKDIVTVLSGEI